MNFSIRCIQLTRYMWLNRRGVQVEIAIYVSFSILFCGVSIVLDICVFPVYLFTLKRYHSPAFLLKPMKLPPMHTLAANRV